MKKWIKAISVVLLEACLLLPAAWTASAASVSINDVSQYEGNIGMSVFDFTVSLSEMEIFTVMVDWMTADDTAIAGEDYNSVIDGSVIFLPGDTSQVISVDVNRDTTYENDETFIVILFSVVNASIDDGWGLGTILDDDSPAASIPIPSAVWLLGSGLIGLLGFRRKFSKGL